MGEVERNVLDLQGGGLYNRPSLFGEDWDWLNEVGLPTYIGRWGKLYCSTLRAILLRMITYIGRIGEQYRSVSLLFRGDIEAFVVGGCRSLGGGAGGVLCPRLSCVGRGEAALLTRFALRGIWVFVYMQKLYYLCTRN